MRQGKKIFIFTTVGSGTLKDQGRMYKTTGSGNVFATDTLLQKINTTNLVVMNSMEVFTIQGESEFKLSTFFFRPNMHFAGE